MGQASTLRYDHPQPCAASSRSRRRGWRATGTNTSTPNGAEDLAAVKGRCRRVRPSEALFVGQPTSVSHRLGTRPRWPSSTTMAAVPTLP